MAPQEKETSLAEKIEMINEVLKAGEPNNYSADHKGYTGYTPQHVIDAINSELTGEWKVEVTGKETYPTKKKDGTEQKNAFVSVRVSIMGISFDSMASHPILDDVGDAFKSAQTDAMKKALSHFSIGNRAYHGLLEKKEKTSGLKANDDLDL